MSKTTSEVIDYEKFNADVRKWAAAAESMMEAGISVDTGKTKKSIARKYKRSGETYERISFPFARTGIYIETGANRGHGGKKGSTWYNKKGERRSTNPYSLGLMGLGLKKERPWLNPALEEKLPELNHVVTNFFADATVRAYKIILNEK